MLRFTQTPIIKAPIQVVANFHRDSRALNKLTPPMKLVRFRSVKPPGEGSKTDFTMWFGPIPIRWVAVHSNVDPLHGFTDALEVGPFANWIHTHSFSPVDEVSTRIVDEIQAGFHSSPIIGFVSRLFWYSLPLLFRYRSMILRKALIYSEPPNDRPILSYEYEIFNQIGVE
jgi:ligand-binding SRPBCC domain-containing protein